VGPLRSEQGGPSHAGLPCARRPWTCRYGCSRERSVGIVRGRPIVPGPVQRRWASTPPDDIGGSRPAGTRTACPKRRPRVALTVCDREPSAWRPRAEATRTIPMLTSCRATARVHPRGAPEMGTRSGPLAAGQPSRVDRDRSRPEPWDVPGPPLDQSPHPGRRQGALVSGPHRPRTRVLSTLRTGSWGRRTLLWDGGDQARPRASPRSPRRDRPFDSPISSSRGSPRGGFSPDEGCTRRGSARSGRRTTADLGALTARAGTPRRSLGLRVLRVGGPSAA
jgi:hypothetical protein